VSAKAIEAGRQKQGAFTGIGDFLERSGVLEEVALNIAGAGGFDSLEPNRRKVKWEIGLRYRPINSQLSLPLPVNQDMVNLNAPGDWERMQEEYKVLSLFPAGHVMEKLRPRFRNYICCSKDIAGLRDGAEIMTAGLVIRRQRPRGKVVFITLEDEFGHIPLMVFPQVYEKQEQKFKSPFLIVRGTLSRREGTHNVVVNQVKTFNALEKLLESKDWR
jgi:error-prone DNA polymerase